MTTFNKKQLLEENFFDVNVMRRANQLTDLLENVVTISPDSSKEERRQSGLAMLASKHRGQLQIPSIKTPGVIAGSYATLFSHGPENKSAASKNNTPKPKF
jgi:hypothetical protein